MEHSAHDPRVWRHDIAGWPLSLREQWGLAADRLMEQGFCWQEAESRAYRGMCAYIKKWEFEHPDKPIAFGPPPPPPDAEPGFVFPDHDDLIDPHRLDAAIVEINAYNASLPEMDWESTNGQFELVMRDVRRGDRWLSWHGNPHLVDRPPDLAEQIASVRFRRAGAVPDEDVPDVKVEDNRRQVVSWEEWVRRYPVNKRDGDRLAAAEKGDVLRAAGMAMPLCWLPDGPEAENFPSPRPAADAAEGEKEGEPLPPIEVAAAVIADVAATEIPPAKVIRVVPKSLARPKSKGGRKAKHNDTAMFDFGE